MTELRADAFLANFQRGLEALGARGRMRVLVVGIPDIADDDYFPAEAVS